MADSIGAFLDEWAAAEQTGDTEWLETLLTGDFAGIGPLGFLSGRIGACGAGVGDGVDDSAPGCVHVRHLPMSPWLGSHVRLARTSPRSLARHDRAAQEELAAPDSPGLPPLPCSGEAGGPRGALPAESLGRLYVIRRLGEEQLRVICAGQVSIEARDRQQRCESRRWQAAVVLARSGPVIVVGPACG